MIVLAELPSFHALSTAHCPLFTVHCSLFYRIVQYPIAVVASSANTAIRPK
jgi:hypothetical protein